MNNTRASSAGWIVRALLVVLALVGFIVVYLFCYEPTYSGLLAPVQQPLVFAHRGFGEEGPDNSLVAAKMAMAADMDGVDVDGQISADKVLIIYHDLSVDRLTSGSGRVSSKTAAELQALDLGEKYGHGFAGKAPVSSFEDFVREITPQGILMVELKAPGIKPSGIEEAAAAVIEKYQAHDKVMLSSFNPFVLYRLKKLDPRIRTVFIFMDTNWNAELLREIRPEDLVNLPWIVRQEFIRRAIRKLIKPDGLSVNHEVDEAVTDRLHAKGYPVFLWTIDEPQRLQWALAKKPYGVISDQPRLAQQLRDAGGPQPAVD